MGNAVGRVAANSVTAIQVAGRAGVPVHASAAVLNVMVTGPANDGCVTVFPCGGTPPTASNLNYLAGQTISNAAITKIGTAGQVCIFSQSATELIVDVNGDSGTTIDGQSQAIGIRPAGSVTEVVVAGRGGVPGNATAVVLNVTVTEPAASGFVTVYPCGGTPPTASNLNYGPGVTIVNAVITKIGDGGKVCIFTQQDTQLVADVNAYFSS